MVRYRTFSVYFMTNKLYGTLYTGVTSDLIQRIGQHREASMAGFTKRYNLKRLVWYEHQPNADAAILREKRVKRWDRDWKIALVEAMNPSWEDLWPRLLR